MTSIRNSYEKEELEACTAHRKQNDGYLQRTTSKSNFKGWFVAAQQIYFSILQHETDWSIVDYMTHYSIYYRVAFFTFITLLYQFLNVSPLSRLLGLNFLSHKSIHAWKHLIELDWSLFLEKSKKSENLIVRRSMITQSQIDFKTIKKKKKKKILLKAMTYLYEIKILFHTKHFKRTNRISHSKIHV